MELKEDTSKFPVVLERVKGTFEREGVTLSGWLDAISASEGKAMSCSLPGLAFLSGYLAASTDVCHRLGLERVAKVLDELNDLDVIQELRSFGEANTK